jgi:TRAP-type C4-dicarboxylate transport system permease small subunit
MKKAGKIIVALSHYLVVLSSICMVAMMLLIVSNVLMRVLFKSPIFGTFEYVGFLTALVISFAVANCGVKNGHVAVDLFIDKFPRKVQRIIDFILGIMSTYFLGLFTWHMIKFGSSLMQSGEVSSTTRTPLHFFVYLVAFGLFLLTVVVLFKTIGLIDTEE